MKKGKIIAISGPSGSGKTTLHKKLLVSRSLKGKLVKSVSVTTRPRRPGEKNGRDYIFVSHKMFLYKKRAGQFLESQKVFDHYYGTPKRSVREILKSGKSVLLCIDVKGVKVVCRIFPKTVKIFIKTPTLAVLKQRLESRGSDSKNTIKLRLETARKELKDAPNYDYTAVNDNLADTLRKLEAIIISEINDYR